MDFKQPRRLCPRCGLEISDNQAVREWKPGHARIACENCARRAKTVKPGRFTLEGEQMKIEAPTIKI